MKTDTRPSKPRGRTQALSEQIRELARSLEPNSKLPTIQELKRELNVSIATLDNALTQLESQNIIYRKHGVGIFVSPHLDDKCVGLVVSPEFFQAGTSPFWQQLIEGTRARASSKGELFRFYLGVPTESGLPVNHDLAEDVIAGRLNGILYIGENSAAIDWLEARQIPVVGFAGRAAYNVHLDYELLIQYGVEQLLQRDCQRLALIKSYDWSLQSLSYPELSVSARHFADLLERKGIAVEAALIQDAAYLEAKDLTSQMLGYGAIERLFVGADAPRPDGLLITSDMITRGALVALQKLGLEVGQDIYIASHINRNSDVLQGYEEQITLIEIDPAEVVAALFDTLEPLMQGRKPPSSIVRVAPHLKS